MKKVLIPLPSYGFDPTEVAIPWKLLSEAGFEPVFISPAGTQASLDKRMLKGIVLGGWKSTLHCYLPVSSFFI
ncbi:type 1 glutamine amidotransferase domain-containing protein [Pseudomonadales bacterium]|nr:type 1 glutamine amidotransferase domain-containing protein [Pseudomonadales bacterium]